MLIRLENEVYDLEISGHRYLLHQKINEIADDFEADFYDEYYEDIARVHELISSKDKSSLINGFWANGEIIFFDVEEGELLENALAAAGYEVRKSNVSKSIYAINDENIEVRISDHKRPAYEHNGSWFEHEYDSEIIAKNNTVNGKQLISAGFGKLDKNKEYLLW